jgi:hypothetical protein
MDIANWKDRYEELNKDMMKELAAVLKGMRAHETETAGADWEALDVPMQDHDEDWFWNAKWAWQRVATEMNFVFKNQLNIAAEDDFQVNLLDTMAEIYVEKFPETEEDAIKEAIRAQSDKLHTQRAEKRPEQVSGAAKKAKTRRAKDVNVEEVARKAREDALKSVQADLNKAKADKEKADETMKLYDAAVEQRDQLKLDLETAQAALATQKGSFASLMSATKAHCPEFNIRKDEDGLWEFLPKVAVARSRSVAPSVYDASPNSQLALVTQNPDT